MLRLAFLSLILVVLGFAPGNARDMLLTIYDDGRSCPGDCDAHVVINRQDNGSSQAFRPDSPRSNPAPCVDGQMCRICFGTADSTCMDVRYRGGGPPAGKFDFTPRFYAEQCGRADAPLALQNQCAALDAAARSLGYHERIDCFQDPDHALCAAAVARAKAAQEDDAPEWDRCKAIGEAAYNREQSSTAMRRALGCNYTEASLGQNSAGVRWRKLLPAACREGSFVGRDGLDCCTSDVRFAASVHPECTPYFPRP